MSIYGNKVTYREEDASSGGAVAAAFLNNHRGAVIFECGATTASFQPRWTSMGGLSPSGKFLAFIFLGHLFVSVLVVKLLGGLSPP